MPPARHCNVTQLAGDRLTRLPLYLTVVVASQVDSWVHGSQHERFLTPYPKRAMVDSMKDDVDPSRLSAAECVLLAEQLWEHARAHPEEVSVTPAQLDEIHRRLDARESGKMPPGESWELVRGRLFRR